MPGLSPGLDHCSDNGNQDPELTTGRILWALCRWVGNTGRRCRAGSDANTTLSNLERVSEGHFRTTRYTGRRTPEWSFV